MKIQTFKRERIMWMNYTERDSKIGFGARQNGFLSLIRYNDRTDKNERKHLKT